MHSSPSDPTKRDLPRIHNDPDSVHLVDGAPCWATMAPPSATARLGDLFRRAHIDTTDLGGRQHHLRQRHVAVHGIVAVRQRRSTRRTRRSAWTNTPRRAGDMIILGSKFHRNQDLMTAHHQQYIAQRSFFGTKPATVRSKAPQKRLRAPHNNVQPVLLWGLTAPGITTRMAGDMQTTWRRQEGAALHVTRIAM